MKIVSILICTLLLSGCSLFNASTSVMKNGVEVFSIEHPRYSIVEYSRDGDKESVKVDSTGSKSLISTIVEGATLGMTNEMINPDND